MSIQGKTAILFGAGAIASGYAPLFAEQAENVMIVSRGQSCESLAKRLKDDDSIDITGDIIAVHADASNFWDVERVYNTALEKFGRVDIAVNGSGGNKKVATISCLEDFIKMNPLVGEEMIASNYLAKFYSLQHFARVLKDADYQGSAINITSMSGLHPLSKVISYSAAYAAVESLTASAAQLFANAGIGRVNNVAVGFTIGEQNKGLLLNQDGTYTERAKEIIAGTSQRRFLYAEEIAPSVIYLADDEKSRAINGHTLRVDGGYNLVSLPATSGYEG